MGIKENNIFYFKAFQGEMNRSRDVKSKAQQHGRCSSSSVTMESGLQLPATKAVILFLQHL
jgi:hypothetical protein